MVPAVTHTHKLTATAEACTTYHLLSAPRFAMVMQNILDAYCDHMDAVKARDLADDAGADNDELDRVEALWCCTLQTLVEDVYMACVALP